MISASGLAHGLDQLELRVGTLRVFGSVVRQAMQEGAAEQAGARAGGFRAAQGKTEGTLGGRRRARRAADADDERPAIDDRNWSTKCSFVFVPERTPRGFRNTIKNSV